MLKNLLVPLDGSPLAESALPFARALASRTGAALTLLRAAQYNSLLSDMATDQYRAIESAEDYLTTVSDDLRASGFTVGGGVSFGGSAAEWIAEEAAARSADMVVMATHARIGTGRWLHGSVAEEVVHKSSVPTMLVGAADAASIAPRFAATEPVLVVPLDGSALAETALPLALGLAKAISARLVLVGVLPAHSTDGQPVSGCLEGTAERIQGQGFTIEVVERAGDPATEIAAAAVDHGAAAVIMATHGRSGLARTILGSVAGGVVHENAVPVVLVRPTHPPTEGTVENES